MIRQAEINGDSFTIWLPEQPIHQIFINDKTQSELPIGWVMLLAQTKAECSILYIQIRPKFRRKGYAKKIIAMLQNTYDKIVTDYEPKLIDEPSTKLLMDCGFRISPSIHKNVPGRMLWLKGKNNECKPTN
jgi:hypothetical protein